MRVAALVALMLALAGCGASDKPAPRRATIFVAALGDAITAGSPGYDPVHAHAKLLGFDEDPKSQWEYWAERKDPRLSFRNCGVYGERTDQIARRLVACQTGADVLVVQGGINDLVQGRAPAAVARNLRSMVRRGRALGVRVEIAELPPWNNGHPGFDREIRGLNRLIRRLARDEGVRVLPFYRTLEDPSRPGRMKEEWTADGDHPSVEGYRRLGELAFRLP